MSDTFTFIAPVMPRRRADPFAVKLATVGLVLIVLISGFATFVVAQERAADARHAALEARTRAEASATADRLAVTPVPAVADDPVVAGPVPGGVANLLDGQARDAAERALALARSALGGGDLATAGATALSDADPSLLFVDGPSTAPSIVSVAVSGGVWAAAVMGPSGACYWVSFDTHGVVRYDRSRACTGQAALGAAHTAW
ncbi:MAG TPA: hypothetical protein VF968_07515 [Actinomycetota bacterium]